MLYDYQKLKEILVKKGANAKLFDMPAIKERLLKQDISPDDITINADGTFNFGNCIMQKKKIEKEETESVYHHEVDDYGVDVSYFSNEKKKVEHDVIGIVEYEEVINYADAALDAPFSIDADYESEYKQMMALLTYVDSDGIEIETQLIDNEPFVKGQLEKGKLGPKSFEDRQDLVSKKIIREDGLITEKILTDRVSIFFGKESQFYDNGRWNIDLTETPSMGTREGRKPGAVISRYEANSQEILRKYPHLKSAVAKRKEELITQIDERTLSLISTLESDNEKLQKMLKKTLTFAQTVRNSIVGKIFFGRKGKELLGEQIKDAKKLPEVPENR